MRNTVSVFPCLIYPVFTLYAVKLYADTTSCYRKYRFQSFWKPCSSSRSLRIVSLSMDVLSP